MCKDVLWFESKEELLHTILLCIAGGTVGIYTNGINLLFVCRSNGPVLKTTAGDKLVPEATIMRVA